MARKKRPDLPVVPKPNDGWEYITEMQINGRYVEPGTELKISGERGRFRFIKKVNTGKAEWIDVWGGPKGAECMRSFKVEKVSRVHYKNTTAANLLKASKAAKLKEKEDSEQELDD